MYVLNAIVVKRIVFTISVMKYIIVKHCIRISVNIMQKLDLITVYVWSKVRGKNITKDNYSSVCNIISCS